MVGLLVVLFVPSLLSFLAMRGPCCFLCATQTLQGMRGSCKTSGLPDRKPIAFQGVQLGPFSHQQGATEIQLNCRLLTADICHADTMASRQITNS